jgi:hypothetical protein
LRSGVAAETAQAISEYFPQRRQGAKKEKNSKHEIRNPKQCQITKIEKFKTGFPRFGFWISQI